MARFKQLWVVSMIVFLVITVILGVFFYLYQPNTNTTIQPPQNNQNMPPGTSFPIGEDVLQNVENSTLAESQEVDSGTYLFQKGDQAASEPNPEFLIYYYPEEKDYSIILLKQPLSESRKNAESAFMVKMSDLGLTQEQVCSLSVEVKTIDSVDPEYSGRNLGLSFCPGSVDLP